MIFEREYSTGVYLLAPGTEVIGAMLVSLWGAGAIDLVAALSLINIALVGDRSRRRAALRRADFMTKGHDHGVLTVNDLHLDYGSGATPTRS